MKTGIRLLFITLVSLVVAACNSDGDGGNISNLQVEMCDLRTSARQKALSCVLDDDQVLEFSAPLNVQWAQTPDSVYRALIYYNKVEGESKVDALSAVMAIFLRPVPADKDEWSHFSDPVDMVSTWQAKNGRYINLCLSLKTGVSSGLAHKVTMVCDSISAAGSRHYYRFCHSQDGIPTDYGVEEYVSVPIDSLAKGDTVTIAVPTFGGMVSKDFVK